MPSPLEELAFVAIVVLLASGNFIYLFARLGYLHRRAAHRAAPRGVLESIYDRAAPRLGILIPSYKEEERVLLQTVLSVALLEYPQRRITVLLDDPPDASGPDLAALQSARAMVRDLNATFAARARSVERERLDFLTRVHTKSVDGPAERARLATIYRELAEWLESWEDRISASSTPATAHTDRLFISTVLRRPASEHRARAEQLCSQGFDAAKLSHEYERAVALLKVEIESFERKRYANLSHQPNKAMNLNSYIGLIGGDYRETSTEQGVCLTACAAEQANIRVPPVDFLLTIDADSFVCPDYALRLIRIMEDDPRIAVAQTPYSAVPEPPTLLERAAGATTDIQYIIHQGFTQYGATYWVGANAMLRLSALRDVCRFAEERGHRVPVFIQDRTVIEDTGSTVDLIRRGWRLHNYPERLAFSATPPDFGALIIQRRRWSNGGLIILPDLVRHVRQAGALARHFAEAAMRAHYLVSPAVANFALLALLLYRFDDSLASVWLPLTAAPYYLAYGRDLRFAGYRWSDLFRVYALNLLLLPVNLAGVLRSLQQLATGRKAAFGRTPKVECRTVVPPIYLVFHGLLLTYLGLAFMLDVVQGLYSHAGYALASTAVLVYALHSFMGWRDSWADLREGLAPWWQRRRFPVATDPAPIFASQPVAGNVQRLPRAIGEGTSPSRRTFAANARAGSSSRHAQRVN